jgi:hypothetical protein
VIISETMASLNVAAVGEGTSVPHVCRAERLLSAGEISPTAGKNVCLIRHFSILVDAQSTMVEENSLHLRRWMSGISFIMNVLKSRL